jgi:hypothetical protein
MHSSNQEIKGFSAVNATNLQSNCLRLGKRSPPKSRFCKLFPAHEKMTRDALKDEKSGGSRDKPRRLKQATDRTLSALDLPFKTTSSTIIPSLSRGVGPEAAAFDHVTTPALPYEISRGFPVSTATARGRSSSRGKLGAAGDGGKTKSA